MSKLQRYNPPLYVGETAYKIFCDRNGEAWAKANLRKYKPLPINAEGCGW